jgi:hypothetical protein
LQGQAEQRFACGDGARRYQAPPASAGPAGGHLEFIA